MYNKNTRLCTGRANKMIFQKWARTHDGAKDNSTTKKKRCRAVEKQIKKQCFILRFVQFVLSLHRIGSIRQICELVHVALVCSVLLTK